MKNTFLALLPLGPSLIALLNIHNPASLRTLLQSLAISLAGFILTNALIPTVGSYTMKAGLFGKDLGKKGSPNEDKKMYVDDDDNGDDGNGNDDDDNNDDKWQ